MKKWCEVGDGEYTRPLGDGRVVKVFQQLLLWRGAVDDRMIDQTYFDQVEAMQSIDAWEAGREELTFHPIDRRWLGDDCDGYSRKSQQGPLTVKQSPCGNWKINQVDGRCFRDDGSARRYADERLP